MIEAELKITLDAAALARLRRHPVLRGSGTGSGTGAQRTQTLVSVYYDTPDHALAGARIALRLRRIGNRWVQTIKRRDGGVASGGFFAQEESERPAPGGRLVLEGPDEDGALAAVAEAVAGAPLAPVFETRVRRTLRRLASEAGEVELALDEGEIVAGARRAPIREAEIELVSGEVGAVFEVARQIFTTGPVQVSVANKAALGYALARSGAAETAPKPRQAGSIEVDAEATIETVARDVMRDCLAQIAVNMAVVATSQAVEGPHQLRVGLRRLRTAFLIFGPSLGKASMAALSERARELGQIVGALRDADVLIEEVVAHTAGPGLDAAAAEALAGALEARRSAVREAVRGRLAEREAVSFLFDLGEFIEARGWLAPSDYSQSERLAMPVGEVAPRILEKRYRAVMKLGKAIRDLDTEGLHDLRKALKKLRYAVEMVGPIYRHDGGAASFLKSLKDLQDAFGSLNDAAMAHREMTGDAAPAREDPAAQRAIGWTLGTLEVRVGDDRPDLYARWDRLRDAGRFWR